jgi:hypothetical protein
MRAKLTAGAACRKRSLMAPLVDLGSKHKARHEY